MRDIDWSKAPKHYDYHLSYKTDSGNSGFCCIAPNGGYCFLDGDGASNPNDWTITLRPQLRSSSPAYFGVTPETKPAYTQAMADNEELPSVGMECMIQFTKGANPEKCKVIGLYGNEVWVLLYDGMCTHSEKIEDYTLSAIDTRTDKEKAIDYMQYAFDKGNNMADVFSEIEKGHVIGVSLQPLTVEK